MAEKTVAAPSGPPQRNGDGDREMTRGQELYVRPPVDIYEKPDGLVLMADLPGVPKENLEVRVEDGLLTIKAKAAHMVPGEPVYREFELPGFFRQFEIVDEIDTEKIKAELKNGVLTLSLPLSEKAKPKKIEVKVAE
jgi:HSP20 family molecular chaperone IbpA